MTAREKLAQEISSMSPGQQWTLKLTAAVEYKLRHLYPRGPEGSAIEEAWTWALSHIPHPDEVKK